jgi:hypothetical protein
MKKAKLMFTALAVMAVVGGTLAFKSSKDITTFYTSNNGQHEVCDIAIQSASVENQFGEVFNATTQSGASGANCTIRLIGE